MYYAINDWTVKNEYSSGFANSKEIIAFATKSEREEWLSSTKYLNAEPVTATQAKRLAKKWGKTGYDGQLEIKVLGGE